MIKVLDGFIQVCTACTRTGLDNGAWVRKKDLDYHDQRQYTSAKYNHGIKEVICPKCQQGKTTRLSKTQLTLRTKS